MDEEPRAASSETIPLPSFGTAVGARSRTEPSIRVQSEAPRYRELGLIATGGMSEVWRVWDEKLRRPLAMKVLAWEFLEDQTARKRFVDEASITAGLQHPGIVPVHDWGELEDGRLFFTMQEVRGATLGEIIRELHAEREPGSSEPSWNLHRVIEAFRRACEAVAFAHVNDVLHRDLKPANIMVSALSGVHVLDWGLATTDSSDDGAGFGTPEFMSPEHAAGTRLSPASDVYSLGVVLHAILFGEPPVRGNTREILAALRSGVAWDLKQAWSRRPSVPDALVATCQRALESEPALRHPNAEELSSELGSWLENSRRRDAALRIVSEADGLPPEIERLTTRAAATREHASELLREGTKAEAWKEEEAALVLERQADVMLIRWLELLRSALNVDDTLTEAHERLASHYREQILRAEAAGRRSDALRAEELLRVHDRGEHAAFLDGRGTLTLHTEPAKVRVTALRYVEHGRRLVLEKHAELGCSPIEGARLPHGSYLLILRRDGCETVRYPVRIERASQWEAKPPGETRSLPVRMLVRASVPARFVRIPAGWFPCGGDADAPDGLPLRHVWLDEFWIGRYPVTNREYLEFLNALVAEGREADAIAAAPRSPLGVGPDAGPSPIMLARDPTTGAFSLTTDQVGQKWLPDAPITLVDWKSALSYAAWRSRALGLEVALPNELEWEKAMRGVDGRAFPWGNVSEATWSNVLGSQRDPGLTSVTSFPVDNGPYGVRQGAGNVREWCSNRWRFEGPEIVDGRIVLADPPDDDLTWRAVRGGAWHSLPHMARLAGRFVAEPYRRFSSLGFRVVVRFGREAPHAFAT